LEGLFYTTDVVIMFWSYEYWLLLLECAWDQARHWEIRLFKRLHRQWASIDQDDYLLIVVISSGDYVFITASRHQRLD